MDDYETLLVEYLKDGKISMDNYVQLNNTNLLNIKNNLLVVNKFDNLFKDGFNMFLKEIFIPILFFTNSNLFTKSKVGTAFSTIFSF